MTDSILELYVNDGLSDEEIDQQRATYGPLTGDVRELIQLALQTRVDADDVARAREHLAAAREILERDREDGPYGTRFNDSGRFRNWGNAAIGLRNAIAPIGGIHEDDDGRVWTDIHLGPVYEGAGRARARRGLRTVARPDPRRRRAHLGISRDDGHARHPLPQAHSPRRSARGGETRPRRGT